MSDNYPSVRSSSRRTLWLAGRRTSYSASFSTSSFSTYYNNVYVIDSELYLVAACFSAATLSRDGDCVVYRRVVELLPVSARPQCVPSNAGALHLPSFGLQDSEYCTQLVLAVVARRAAQFKRK